MREEPSVNLARLAALALLLSALWGCLEYKEVVTVTSDGSGTVEIDATIPERIAADYRTGTYTGKTPAPVREGVIQQWFTGSTGARITDLQVELINNVWTYRVTLDFDSIRSLARVKYFKGRNISVSYPSAKELRFRQEIWPTLLQMAKDQAKLLSDDAYVPEFLAKVDTDGFRPLLADSKLKYQVVMPGLSAQYNGTYTLEANDNIRATRDLTMAVAADQTAKEVMDIRATLPPEQGFTPVVVLLLLASLAGILVTAIRLLVLKMRGVT